MFGVYLSWLPVAGWGGGSLANKILPVITLALPQIAYIARLARGSASGDLLRQSSETLAGRMETLTLRGFSLLGRAGKSGPGPALVAQWVAAVLSRGE